MTLPVGSDQTRVLVTGASGRLGRTVAARFDQAGFDLLATDIVEADDVPYRFVGADLLDHGCALELLEDVDVLVHLGNHPGVGRTPPQLVFNENISMNENVFQGAAERGVGKIVFASTLQQIGSHVDRRTVHNEPPPPVFPIDETMAPQPSNVYALSKTVSEVMLRYYAERCGIDCIALRFPLLHYCEDRVRVSAGEEQPNDIIEGFTGLSYDDASELILAVASTDLPGYRVYAPAVAHRHRDLALDEFIAVHYPDLPATTQDLVDISTIVEETGWRPTPVQHWSDRS
ncbi:MAG TPA: NAD(P)-dependent oxidoreductase [Ilumatobacteraceae bacterium]|nr:NAD(P)-dependent oxidoreductase [Ilumatobacteraceae bacterium]